MEPTVSHKATGNIIRSLMAAIAVVTGVILSTTGAFASASVIRGSPVVISLNDSTCVTTSGEQHFMLHAGGAIASIKKGTYKFTAVHHGSRFNGTYATIGFESGLNSGYYCNANHVWNPVKVGKQGHPVLSAHYKTSSNFAGDTGLDMWFEPSPSDSSYTVMTTDVGKSSVEAMIWFSRPDWKAWAAQAIAHVRIDHHWWFIDAARVGHGKGWTRVFFVAANGHKGNVTVKNLALSPFMTYLMNAHLMPHGDFIEGIDNGAEIKRGSASLCGYTLNGLKGFANAR